MAQTADREVAHDQGGWVGICNRRLEDGSFCHMPYWYAYVASTRMGKRMTSRESGVEHVCRGPLAPMRVAKPRTSLLSDAEGDDARHGKESDEDMPSTAVPEADRVLTPGDTWYADYKGVRYLATVQDGGEVKVEGYEQFKGFSAAAKAITGAVRNGWAFFHKYDPDNPPPVEVVPDPPAKAAKEPKPAKEPKEPRAPRAPRAANADRTPKIGGVTITMTKDEILAKCDEAIAAGADGGASRSWAVNHNGHRMAPKWIVTLITGITPDKFSTGDAVRVLEMVGIGAAKE